MTTKTAQVRVYYVYATTAGGACARCCANTANRPYLPRRRKRANPEGRVIPAREMTSEQWEHAFTLMDKGNSIRAIENEWGYPRESIRGRYATRDVSVKTSGPPPTLGVETEKLLVKWRAWTSSPCTRTLRT